MGLVRPILEVDFPFGWPGGLKDIIQLITDCASAGSDAQSEQRLRIYVCFLIRVLLTVQEELVDVPQLRDATRRVKDGVR